MTFYLPLPNDGATLGEHPLQSEPSQHPGAKANLTHRMSDATLYCEPWDRLNDGELLDRAFELAMICEMSGLTSSSLGPKSDLGLWLDPKTEGGGKLGGFCEQVALEFCHKFDRGFRPLANKSSFGVRKAVANLQHIVESKEWESMITGLLTQSVGSDGQAKAQAVKQLLQTRLAKIFDKMLTPDSQRKWIDRADKQFMDKCLQTLAIKTRDLLRNANGRSEVSVLQSLRSTLMTRYVLEALQTVGRASHADQSRLYD